MLKYGAKKVVFRVGEEPTSYVGGPGNRKYLLPVFIEEVLLTEVGPRNSFGFKPGQLYEGWVGIDGSISKREPTPPPSAYENEDTEWFDKI